MPTSRHELVQSCRQTFNSALIANSEKVSYKRSNQKRIEEADFREKTF